MWMLSGYGDHLEEGMPGLKASAAEAGAPDGFVDVVAQLQPIADGEDTSPHWEVNFANEDVQASAAMASAPVTAVLHDLVAAPRVRPPVIRDHTCAPLIPHHVLPIHTHTH